MNNQKIKLQDPRLRTRNVHSYNNMGMAITLTIIMAIILITVITFIIVTIVLTSIDLHNVTI